MCTEELQGMGKLYHYVPEDPPQCYVKGDGWFRPKNDFHKKQLIQKVHLVYQLFLSTVGTPDTLAPEWWPNPDFPT